MGLIGGGWLYKYSSSVSASSPSSEATPPEELLQNFESFGEFKIEEDVQIIHAYKNTDVILVKREKALYIIELLSSWKIEVKEVMNGKIIAIVIHY